MPLFMALQPIFQLQMSKVSQGNRRGGNRLRFLQREIHKVLKLVCLQPAYPETRYREMSLTANLCKVPQKRVHCGYLHFMPFCISPASLLHLSCISPCRDAADLRDLERTAASLLHLCCISAASLQRDAAHLSASLCVSLRLSASLQQDFVCSLRIQSLCREAAEMQQRCSRSLQRCSMQQISQT